MTANRLPSGVVVADTITKLPHEAAGAVVISGSHGGRYPGYLAAKAGVRAVILCDAGVGLEQAGIGALPWLQALGIAAATVSHNSCRIGDTRDMLERGTISHANMQAARCGVESGQPTREAGGHLTAAALANAVPPSLGEARTILDAAGPRRIVLIDSASLVVPADSGRIVVTGSHGGLVGGDPAMALRVDGWAAVFNDAGIGVDKAGTTRLPALDERGIAAFTVAASSARIGEARSSFEDGIVSAVNATARARGAATGGRARDILLSWAAKDDVS